MAHNIFVIINYCCCCCDYFDVLLRRKVLLLLFSFFFLQGAAAGVSGEARSRWKHGGINHESGSLSLWNQGTVGKGKQQGNNGTRVGQL